ncbi:MAG: S41 family peptidase [Candidatus Oxydemutatoraceae bacterium WSBS_2016_MAG_OTU14]
MSYTVFKQSFPRCAVVFFLLLLVTGASGESKPPAVPYDELRLLSDIYANIKNNYVDEVEDSKLFEGAIHGMLRGLDPYSVYLTKKEYTNLKASTTGKFGGLGIEVSKDKHYLLINAALPGTPAEKAGLLGGDLIVGINKKNVKNMPLSSGIDLMRGEIGTSVVLTIQREKLEPFDVSVTRATIKRMSVRSLLLDGGIAYAHISNFQLKTGRELSNALAKMTKENKNVVLNGIILDLRGNPGGILNEAVSVSDVFLPSNKLVVYTKGRTNPRANYKTTHAPLYTNIPLIVLINKRSASASEIVAGALKDHKRATLMGTQSFGKASVQTIHPIDEKRALKLTTAKYFTPLGHMIHKKGVAPNIAFTEKELKKEEELYKQKLGLNDKSPEEQRYILARRKFDQRIKDDWQVQRAIGVLKTSGKTAQKNTPEKNSTAVPQ